MHKTNRLVVALASVVLLALCLSTFGHSKQTSIAVAASPTVTHSPPSVAAPADNSFAAITADPIVGPANTPAFTGTPPDAMAARSPQIEFISEAARGQPAPSNAVMRSASTLAKPQTSLARRI